MALRLINRSRKPLLHVPRPLFFSSSSNNSSSPPFHPPPPPPSDGPGASPRHPPQNHGDGPQRPAGAASSISRDDIRRMLRAGATPSFQDPLRKSAAPPAGNPQGGTSIRKNKTTKSGAPNGGDANPSTCALGVVREIDPAGKEMPESAGKPQLSEGKEHEAAADLYLRKMFTPEELEQNSHYAFWWELALRVTSQKYQKEQKEHQEWMKHAKTDGVRFSLMSPRSPQWLERLERLESLRKKLEKQEELNKALVPTRVRSGRQ